MMEHHLRNRGHVARVAEILDARIRRAEQRHAHLSAVNVAVDGEVHVAVEIHLVHRLLGLAGARDINAHERQMVPQLAVCGGAVALVAVHVRVALWCNRTQLHSNGVPGTVRMVDAVEVAANVALPPRATDVSARHAQPQLLVNVTLIAFVQTWILRLCDLSHLFRVWALLGFILRKSASEIPSIGENRSNCEPPTASSQALPSSSLSWT